MSPARPDHERISRIFLQAVELDAAQRATFLDEACGDEDELRREIESLLLHDDCAPERLEPGAFASDPATSDPLLPDRIGPYRIVESLGSGGMGVIFRVRQESPIRREVALKLVRAGVATPEAIARFKSERQALALMNHTNIARVLDVGVTEHGQPYFTMEYVDGEPITAFCDRRRMTIRERIELFIQVCHGVQHAHHKAIIHRDIKASNVLVATVDGKPVPKIIDFGIAKAVDRPLTDDSAVTYTGALMGTPEYMSPEQAAANGHDVDTRTDVYSLGVLLYRLLVGALPFDVDTLRDSGPEEIRRTICDTDPAPPSSRYRELEATRAEVARDRRIDAATLGRRLRGDLDWIVLKALEKDPARRYGSPDELVADLRRHLASEPVLAGRPGTVYRLRKFALRNAVPLGATAVVLAAVVGGAVLYHLHLTQVARERAFNDVVFLGLLDLGKGDGIAATDTDLDLEDARRELRRLREGRPERPVDLAAVFVVLLRELGGRHPETLDAMHALGVRWIWDPLPEKAHAVLAQVVERRRAVLGPRHPDTRRSEIALARSLWQLDRFTEAERLLKRTLDRIERSANLEPEALQARRFLSAVYIDQRRLEEAERMIHALLPALRRHEGPDGSWGLASTYNLGCIAALRGEHASALARISDAVERGFFYGGWSEDGLLDFGVDGIRHDPNLKPLHGTEAFEVLLAPDGHLAALQRARLSLKRGDDDDSLGHLRQAVERGFRRADQIERQFEALRHRPEFASILADAADRTAMVRLGENRM